MKGLFHQLAFMQFCLLVQFNGNAFAPFLRSGLDRAYVKEAINTSKQMSHPRFEGSGCFSFFSVYSWHLWKLCIVLFLPCLPVNLNKSSIAQHTNALLFPRRPCFCIISLVLSYSFTNIHQKKTKKHLILKVICSLSKQLCSGTITRPIVPEQSGFDMVQLKWNWTAKAFYYPSNPVVAKKRNLSWICAWYNNNKNKFTVVILWYRGVTKSDMTLILFMWFIFYLCRYLLGFSQGASEDLMV